MSLLSELKEEHALIISLFDEIVKDLASPQVLDKLSELERVTVLHLEKENNELYPPLRNSDIEEVSVLSVQFANSMKKLGEDFLNILSEIRERHDSINDDFKNKVFEIGERLKVRITIEEFTLIPLYEKFLNNNLSS